LLYISNRGGGEGREGEVVAGYFQENCDGMSVVVKPCPSGKEKGKKRVSHRSGEGGKVKGGSPTGTEFREVMKGKRVLVEILFRGRKGGKKGKELVHFSPQNESRFVSQAKKKKKLAPSCLRREKKKGGGLENEIIGEVGPPVF